MVEMNFNTQNVSRFAGWIQFNQFDFLKLNPLFLRSEFEKKLQINGVTTLDTNRNIQTWLNVHKSLIQMKGGRSEKVLQVYLCLSFVNVFSV